MMEQKWDRQLPEGRNPDIKFMAHVWEDLRVLPKPLALHLACEAMSMVGHAVLRYMGFRMDSCQVQPLIPVTCHGLSTPLISLHSDAPGLSGHEPWRGTLCCGTWASAWSCQVQPLLHVMASATSIVMHLACQAMSHGMWGTLCCGTWASAWTAASTASDSCHMSWPQHTSNLFA